MLTPDQCYAKLGKSKVLHTFFSDKLKNLKFSKSFNFDMYHIEKNIILIEPFINKINTICKIKSCDIMKIDPWKCYSWHRDIPRKVGINLLLEPTNDSLVFFGEKDTNIDHQYHIVKLEYEPETFYLFNNQISHTIFNFENTRYLLTISFIDTTDTLDFSSLKKILQYI